MRVLVLSNTAYDLINGPTPAAGQTAGLGSPAPFQPNYTVVVGNISGGTLTLQECDTVDGSYTTLASVLSGFQEVTFSKQFVKVSTAANLYALGN